MILVTVGTHDQQFNRLVKAGDELACLIEEAVFIQRGVSDYTPIRAEFVDFLSMQEMQARVSQARVVIAQAGAGTIISALQQRKPLILIPRLREFGEHYNDHQEELAFALHAQGRAIAEHYPSGETLLAALGQLNLSPDNQVSGNVTQLVRALRFQISAWMPEKRAR